MIINNDDNGKFLLSCKVITQGDPMAMLGYALGILPIIRQLKVEFPEAEQPWYADDAATVAIFARMHAMF
jgi:hypothetical protein